MLQHLHVILLFIWHASQEAIHIEAVHQTRLLLLTTGCAEILAIGVKEASKTTDECGTDLVRLKGGRTDQADLWETSAMSGNMTAC